MNVIDDDELRRLAVLESLDIAGLKDDPRLQAITDFAASLCQVPVSLVSFVEEERQWFAARSGIDVRQTDRGSSFCAHAMLGDRIMIVPDARQHPRFADNPLVTAEPYIRFYAGAPICAEDGTPLGALCVIDSEPREGLTHLQRQGLQVLASNVASLLTLRGANIASNQELSRSEAKFRLLADAMPQMVWSTRPDGYHDYYNARWYEFTGVPIGSTDGQEWNGMFHPEDQERAWTIWRASLATGEPYEIEYRLRNAAGEYRWTLGRALPIRDSQGVIQRWIGTCTDIHDAKLLQQQREVVAHELNHRIKNIFAIINGLINLATRDEPELQAPARALQDRIIALGRAHDFVRPDDTDIAAGTVGSSLHGLFRALLAPYERPGEQRIRIRGTDLMIDDRSATPFALAFHELATNAAKYGALSVDVGSIEIHSHVKDGMAFIEWIEQGGPAVAPPANEGFGGRLMDMSIKRQLGGTIVREWPPSGMAMRISVPSTSICRNAA